MGGLFASCMRDNRENPSPNASQRKPKEMSEADLNFAKLKNIRQDIYEKERSCEDNVNKSIEEIKKLMENGKREQAKYILQRKKLYEGYHTELMKKSGIIENTIVEYQKTKMDKGMVDALKGAQKVIQDINKAIDTSVVMDVVNDANELTDKREEMNRLLDEYNLNVGDLDEELDKIQNENLSQDFKKVGQVNIPAHQESSQNQPHDQTTKPQKVDKQMEELLN